MPSHLVGLYVGVKQSVGGGVPDIERTILSPAGQQGLQRGEVQRPLGSVSRCAQHCCLCGVPHRVQVDFTSQAANTWYVNPARCSWTEVIFFLRNLYS